MRSQNGYPAITRAQCQLYTVGRRQMALRPGPAGWVLAHFLNWFDAEIRDIDPGPLDDWAWAPIRDVRGGDDLSNHCSGTAADVDATFWPLGADVLDHLSPALVERVRKQLVDVYEGAIRWGADYTGRTDPMHFEVVEDEATCARIQTKLTAPAVVEDEEDEEPMPLIIRNASTSARHLLFLGSGTTVALRTEADVKLWRGRGVDQVDVPAAHFAELVARR